MSLRNNIEEWFNKKELEKNIKTKQLERFKERGNFNEFIEKVISKYNSDEYRDHWYNRGIEPPETLYWFLFDFAEKYGRECNDEEWEQYSNLFTSSLFYINGYYFNKINGQGSAITIVKTECNNCN